MRALGAVVGFILLGVACTPHPEAAKRPGAPSASASAAESDAPRAPESGTEPEGSDAWPPVPEVPADADPSTVTVEFRAGDLVIDGVQVASLADRPFVRMWRYLDQRAIPSVRGIMPNLVLRLPPEVSAVLLASLTSIAGYCEFRRVRVELTTGSAVQFLQPQRPAEPNWGVEEASIYIWGDGSDTRVAWLKKAEHEVAKPYHEVVARPGSSELRDSLRRECRPRRPCASAVLEVDPAAPTETVVGLVQAIATVATDDWGPVVVLVLPPPGRDKEPYFATASTHYSGPIPPVLMGETLYGPRGEIDRCFTASRERAPNVAGAVNLRVVVAADGRVKSVSVAESADQPDPALADCLKHFVAGVRFPPPRVDDWTFTTPFAPRASVPVPTSAP